MPRVLLHLDFLNRRPIPVLSVRVSTVLERFDMLKVAEVSNHGTLL